jgi:hypothetical protein
MPWQTFWLEPTGRQRVALRRYVADHPTGAYTCVGGWHQAVRWTGEEIDEVFNEHGYTDPPPAPAHDDPRWPTECDQGCGYRFTEQDHWQPWGESLYRRTDTGELRVLHSTMCPPDVPTAEPGASWDARWMGDIYRGSDGICLTVRCPRPDGSPGIPHDWPVDGPSSSGGRWTRTGDPRAAQVTAGPSIAIGDPDQPGHYHGHLRAGVLT